MLWKRKPQERRYAGSVLDRRDNALSRMRRHAQGEGQRIDFLMNLIGLMENSDYVQLRKMAEAVIEDLKIDLTDIDLSNDEGRNRAIGLQAEIRSMNWFARGTDHLRTELRERKKRMDDLQYDIKEADKIDKRKRDSEEKSRRKNA